MCRVTPPNSNSRSPAWPHAPMTTRSERRLCLGEEGGACLSIFAIDKDDLRFDTVARQMMLDIHD